MAPVLFSLYTCVVLERWKARVEGVDGAGINLKYISTTTCSLGDTPVMLPRGNSLSVSLLMMVLSLLELDQVPRELCRCTRQPALISALL